MNDWAGILSDAVFEGGTATIEFEVETREEAVELITKYAARLESKWREVEVEKGHAWFTTDVEELDIDEEQPSVIVNVFVDLEGEMKNNK